MRFLLSGLDDILDSNEQARDPELECAVADQLTQLVQGKLDQLGGRKKALHDKALLSKNSALTKEMKAIIIYRSAQRTILMATLQLACDMFGHWEALLPEAIAEESCEDDEWEDEEGNEDEDDFADTGALDDGIQREEV